MDNTIDYYYNERQILVILILLDNRETMRFPMTINIIGSIVIGFSLGGIIACCIYKAFPVAMTLIGMFNIIFTLATLGSLQYIILEKKITASMVILATHILLTIYCMVLGLTLLLYLNGLEHNYLSKNPNFQSFMLSPSITMSFSNTIWASLPFYIGNGLSLGFFARQYYRIFWVNNIVYIYRFLKKRVTNLNETLLSELPIIQFSQKFEGLMCCLCLEVYNKAQPITTLVCQHFYHRNCIRVWVIKSNACPLCRRRVIYK